MLKFRLLNEISSRANVVPTFLSISLHYFHPFLGHSTTSTAPMAKTVHHVASLNLKLVAKLLSVVARSKAATTPCQDECLYSFVSFLCSYFGIESLHASISEWHAPRKETHEPVLLTFEVVALPIVRHFY